eukprot:4031382-Alexandrium_andersonii.AAC.1
MLRRFACGVARVALTDPALGSHVAASAQEEPLHPIAAAPASVRSPGCSDRVLRVLDLLGCRGV